METIGRTSNLLVNPDAEQSSRNFPLYGWTKEDGNCRWSSLTQVTYGSKTAKPHSGSYLFAPLNRDNVKYSVDTSSSKTYDLSNLPGLLPGGHRPGKHTPGQLTTPSGHTPGTPPYGMPSIPGLPFMQSHPSVPNLLPGVPSLPNLPGVTGMPGIPSLPGMPTEWSVSGVLGSIPIIPGVLNMQQIVNMIDDAANYFAAHTTLTQIVDISMWKNYIDISQQTFDFSGWYCADNGEDKSEIFIQALDTGNKELRHWDSGQYNGKNWKQFSLTNQLLPVGTRQLKVNLRVSKSAGHSYYAGFFDACSLTLPIYKLPATISASTVEAGKTVKITPALPFSGILYRSLNPDIAAVDSYGTVTGLKAGTAKIQVCDPVFTEAKNELSVKVAGSVAPPPPPPPPPTPSKMSMSLNQTNYTYGGEQIVATVTDVTQADIDNKAIIWHCPAGEPHNSTKGWQYSFLMTGKNTFTMIPSTPGSYEMKLYANANNRNDSTLLKRIPFTVSPAVTPSAPSKMELYLIKTSFTAGVEKVIVVVTGVAQSDLDSNAKVWYGPAGEGHDSAKGWWYSLTKTGTNLLEFDTSAAGSYEVKLYANAHVRNDSTLLKTLPLKIVRGKVSKILKP